MASRLAFIQGMLTQPRNAPKHQTQTLPLKARQKFSVHMESIRQPQMAFTRLLGVFMKEARMLPSSVEMPMTVLTTPMARSEAFDSTMAGNAALYMDATRLIPARNSIRCRIPGFRFSQRMPSAALFRMPSLSPAASIRGMGIKNSSVAKAIRKLARSMVTTASIPQSPSTAVAKIGVRIEVTEEERYRRPPTFW